MMKQEFTPALKIMKDGEIQKIESRNWSIAKKSSSYKDQDKTAISEEMGVLGVQQIEEVWKFYAHVNDGNSGVYVSNLGYVMEMSNETAQKFFGDKFMDKENGVEFRTLNEEQKKCIRWHNFVPENDKSSGFQIDLYVKQLEKKFGRDAKVYRMVAKTFLAKPDGKDIVHHIDNNSYNNSVTNLIWVSGKEHNPKVHPMSSKHCWP